MSFENLSALNTSSLATARSSSIDPACSWRDMTAEQIQSAKSCQIFWGIMSSLLIAGSITCFAFAGIYTNANRDYYFLMVSFYAGASTSLLVGVITVCLTVKDREFEYHPYSYPTSLNSYGPETLYPSQYYYEDYPAHFDNTPESRSNMLKLFKMSDWPTINNILNRGNYQEHLLNLGPLVRNKMITIEWAEKLKELGKRYKKECKLDKNKSLGEPAWTRIWSSEAMHIERASYEAYVALHGEPVCPRQILDEKFQAEWRKLQLSLIFDSIDAMRILPPPPILDIVRDYYR